VKVNAGNANDGLWQGRKTCKILDSRLLEKSLEYQFRSPKGNNWSGRRGGEKQVTVFYGHVIWFMVMPKLWVHFQLRH
jgi:hypothetical protein